MSSAAEPADSEPGPAPSLPADVGMWRDSDAALPPAPPRPYPTPVAGKADGELATIGHIGRYALKYRIGEGGLGTVFAAHDPLLSRLIAIKTLNLEIAAEEREAFNKLFLNEARAAGGLSHPNIVTVFDAGVSDDKAYIAMELLKGRDLRQLRQEGWRPTAAQSALIVRRVADALAYAHSKGVVHRDIKPANIFMVGRTQPRVLDFGIARVAHQHEAGEGDIAAGSPYYMAPEQARQQPVDRRADVFSLGVVLYELLTDQKPFRGTNLAEITTAVIEHQPPAANLVDPSVPQALAEIAARAMEKDPEHRFRSARAFARELRHWIEETEAAGDSVPMPAPAARSRRRLALTAGLAGLAMAGVLWATFGRHQATAQPADDGPGAAAVTVATAPVALAVPAAATAAGPSAAASTSDSTPAPAAKAAPAKAPPMPAPMAAVPTPPNATAKAAPKPPTETAKDKRARELREREARAAPSSTVPAAAVATGVVRIAVSPWGQVEVDGAAAGTAPPLTELSLTEGRHQITIRNADYPPYSASVVIVPGTPAVLKYKFGS